MRELDITNAKKLAELEIQTILAKLQIETGKKAIVDITVVKLEDEKYRYDVEILLR